MKRAKDSFTDIPDKTRTADRAKRFIAASLDRMRDAHRNIPKRLKYDTDLRALFESVEGYLMGITDYLKVWEEEDISE